MVSMFDTKSKDLQGDQFYSKISFFTTSVYYDFIYKLVAGTVCIVWYRANNTEHAISTGRSIFILKLKK